MIAPEIQAEVLSQALPYIQSFRGQTFVIKYGGSAMEDPAAIRSVIRNVLLLQIVGIKTILVHGGGPEIERWLDRLGMESRTIDGLRVTDESTMEVVEMALSGRANKQLVGEVHRAGGKALGFSGRDGGILIAEPVSDRLGRVGKIVSVDPQALDMATDSGFVPIVCSVASDSDGRALNVNADSAAASIAQAVRASKLILLTDTDGVLSDSSNPRSTISSLTVEEVGSMVRLGTASQGMIPKLESAVEALKSGVGNVHILNGGTENAILLEVFTDLGIGTMLVLR